MTPTIHPESFTSSGVQPVRTDLDFGVKDQHRFSKVDVSLVICTRNRSRQLSHCLQSLRCLEFERTWELILVDNGSSDATEDVVRAFRDNAPTETTLVFEPKAGLANARNAGLKISRGEIVAFTDDDCYPAPEFLSRIWSAFGDGAIGFITGRITLHDPADYPITINESDVRVQYKSHSFVRAGTVQGANMAFRREVLLQIGGFDPLFGAGSLFPAEDADAAGRASSMGWRGQYCPEVTVRHHHGRKACDLARLMKSYHIGRGAYHMKLLLKGRQFLLFARAHWELPRRIKWWGVTTAYWEAVGGCRYAFEYLRRSPRTGRDDECEGRTRVSSHHTHSSGRGLTRIFRLDR